MRDFQQFALLSYFKVILLLALSASTTAIHAGEWHKGVNAGVYGVRNYKVYVSDKAKKLDRPALVVFIHGCEQDAEEFARGARMIEASDKEGFVLLLPEQNKNYNPYKCWNWVLPANLGRAGEPEVIRQMTDETIERFNLDADRVFVAGMSSGAGMVNILGNCYPEKFKALASHDGTMYNSTNVALDYEEVVVNGPSVAPWISAFKGYLCASFVDKPKSMPIIIFHGNNGPLMSPVHAFQIENQMKVYNDYLDNGKRDYSYFKEKSVTVTKDTDKYGHTLFTVVNKFNQPFIERYMINHLGHAWSGGDAKYPYNDPKGPDATKLVIQFFKKYGL